MATVRNFSGCVWATPRGGTHQKVGRLISGPTQSTSPEWEPCVVGMAAPSKPTGAKESFKSGTHSGGIVHVLCCRKCIGLYGHEAQVGSAPFWVNWAIFGPFWPRGPVVAILSGNGATDRSPRGCLCPKNCGFDGRAQSYRPFELEACPD